MLRCLRISAAVLASGLLVAGCGVRGQLQLPKEEAAQQTTATADSGQGKPANTAPKPHKDFILDGLLR
jgi:predicted small lipoprotein YifL